MVSQLKIGNHHSDSQKIDPSTAFDFIPARPSDKDDIVKLCVNEFIHVEPHSKVGFLILLYYTYC